MLVNKDNLPEEEMDDLSILRESNEQVAELLFIYYTIRDKLFNALEHANLVKESTEMTVKAEECQQTPAEASSSELESLPKPMLETELLPALRNCQIGSNPALAGECTESDEEDVASTN